MVSQSNSLRRKYCTELTLPYKATSDDCGSSNRGNTAVCVVV